MYESVFNVLKTKESETRVILNFFLQNFALKTHKSKVFLSFFCANSLQLYFRSIPAHIIKTKITSFAL